MKIGDLIARAKKPFFSLEFFPPAEEAQLERFYGVVDDLRQLKPLFVSVTYGAGGQKQQNTIATTHQLVERGLVAMSHLTCVGATADGIKSYLDALMASGIDNVLALRGDPPMDKFWDWSKGEFRHASDLVKFIKKEQPDMGIGVAAYPAPHPESPTFASDRDYTAAKLEAGADFAISQLFFDTREYIDLVERLRKRGIEVPIVAGVMPVQSFDSLRRVLSLCGARIPAKFYLELEEANASGGAEAVREAGFRFAMEQIGQLLDYGAPGIHLYTLNRKSLCRRIIVESGLA